MAITLPNDDAPKLDDLKTDGPGSRLKKARISKKLEIEDVASRLRLHVRTIQSIEADDYEQLPAPTFVRGYLRGYARIVDLPPDTIVDGYDENDFGPPPLVPDISSREETNSGDFPVRLTTYVVIGVLLLLVVMWWQSGTDKGSVVPTPESVADDVGSAESFLPDTSEPLNESEIIVNSEAAVSETQTSIADSIEAVATDSEQAESLSDAQTQIISAVNEGVVTDLPEAVAVIAQEAVETVESIEPVIEEVALDVAATETVAEPVSSTEPVPRQSPARMTEGGALSLTLAKESWLEIYGASGKRLFYDLAKPNSPITVTEPPPLRLIIGYAEGAVLRYNGNVIDMAPYTFAGVAKLSVGNEGAIGTPQAIDQTQ